MELPESDELVISRLAVIFSDTTNSYKFYWLLAILDGLRETGQIRFSMYDLVASVWYPLAYFGLSFGRQDGFKPIVNFVSERISVDKRTELAHSAPLVLRCSSAIAPNIAI